MEQFKPHSEFGEPLVTPLVQVAGLSLTWLDTRIRTFENNSQFNHIEHVKPNGELVAFFNQEVMDALHEMKYPILDMPFVDKHSFEWLYRLLTKNLTDELRAYEDYGG